MRSYYIIFDWKNRYYIARVIAHSETEALKALELSKEILRAYHMELYVDSVMPEYIFLEAKESYIMQPQKLSRLIKRAYYQDKTQAVEVWLTEYEKELEKWK